MTDFNQRSQKVNTQYNAGGDQTIQNILLVGQFLDFAKVEGLIPKSSVPTDFGSITAAFEQAFEQRLGSDLAQATASAGYILAEAIKKWMPKDSLSALPLKQILEELPSLIYLKLSNLNYWDAFFEISRDISENVAEVVWLHSLNLLWEKRFKSKLAFGIFCYRGNQTAYLCTNRYSERFDHFDYLEIESVTYEQFRVIMAGIVVDLIRLSSIASDDTRFWQGIANLLMAEKKA